METITNLVSVFDNGEVWPHGALIFPEIAMRGATKIILKKWQYKNQEYEINKNLNTMFDIQLLPDQTGLVTIDGNPGKHAYILNGDASVRLILTPAFNMRSFDAERLAVIHQHDEERAKRSGCTINTVIPREEQTCFHSTDTSDGKLEIFGDDGFGDCYYTYDWNTGALKSARTLPRRS